MVYIEEVREQMNAASNSIQGTNPLRIFISHSSADNEFGRRLVVDLRHALGDREDAVWYDSSGGLQGGDSWWDKILLELSTRPVFIPVLSPEAMNSKWVRDEINIAWRQKNSERGKFIVPVLLRPCQMREDLRGLQTISFAAPRPYSQALIELLAVLESYSNPAAASQPETLDTLVVRVEQLLAQRRVAEAVASADRATRIDPKDFRAWYALARAQYVQGGYAEALSAIDRALGIDGNSSVGRNLRGAVLIGLKRDREALAELGRALQLDPQSAQAWANTAVVYFRTERDHDALDACDRALALNSSRVEVWRLKVRVLRALGRESEALEAERRASALGG
jgi:tetratricopeptide (TPR) repeat protein